MYAEIMSNFRKPKGFVGRLICNFMNLGHGPMIREVVELLEIKPGDVVLDVGCGGGLALSYMAERCAKAYGIDYSETAVKAAVKKNKAAIKTGRVEIRQAGVMDMPFPDHMFDLVTAFETIYFWEDLTGCFKRVRRAIKPGGRLIIVVAAWKNGEKKVNCPSAFDCLNLNLYNCEELCELLREAGFGHVGFFTGQRHHWLMALARNEAPSSM